MTELAQKLWRLRQSPQPSANSWPFSGCTQPSGQGVPGGSSFSFTEGQGFGTLWPARLWHGSQKCVVPKQNQQATEQQ